VAVLALAIAALGSAGAVAPTSRACGACHEIAPQVASWKRSPHANVGCASCHEPAYGLSRYPQRLAGRAAMLGRDLWWHVRGVSAAASVSLSASPRVSDAACLQCHDPARTPTSRGGVTIDHAEHAKRNKSCLSCHANTAHPDPREDQGLAMMERCFACHGLDASATAPGTCDTCHPTYFGLPPSTHKPVVWRQAHGKASQRDPRQCEMCHVAKFCDDCHGLPMPHPAGWVRGASGHSAVAAENRARCAQCHGGRPNPCSRCHHRAYGTDDGRWLKRHPEAVKERGTTGCNRCHHPEFCGDCHRSTQR